MIQLKIAASGYIFESVADTGSVIVVFLVSSYLDGEILNDRERFSIKIVIICFRSIFFEIQIIFLEIFSCYAGAAPSRDEAPVKKGLSVA